MFPDRSPTLRHCQQGFLIPLALFILVGMLALALAASRLTGQSSTSATLELLSTQAFFAAESGGQYALHQVSFNSVCAAATLNFTPPGLQSCTATITCTQIPGTAIYTITSMGSCGAGDMDAQREIEISANMQ